MIPLPFSAFHGGPYAVACHEPPLGELVAAAALAHPPWLALSALTSTARASGATTDAPPVPSSHVRGPGTMRAYT